MNSTMSEYFNINKEKVSETFEVAEKDLIDGKFLLLQKGKKNYWVQAQFLSWSC